MSVTKFLFTPDQRVRMQALADAMYLAGITDYKEFAYALADLARSLEVDVEVTKPPEHMTVEDVVRDMDSLISQFGYIAVDNHVEKNN